MPNSFEINYKTNNYDVKFNVSFGEGKDSLLILDEYERKNFKENYNIEVYEKGNKTDDNYMIGYRVVANEGPIVVKLDNIEINSYDNNYIYAHATNSGNSKKVCILPLDDSTNPCPYKATDYNTNRCPAIKEWFHGTPSEIDNCCNVVSDLSYIDPISNKKYMAKISAFLLIQTEVGSERNVYGRLSQIEEVDFLYELFGEWDIIAKVDVESVEALDGFISDNVRTINGVKLTSTVIISS